VGQPAGIEAVRVTGGLVVTPGGLKYQTPEAVTAGVVQRPDGWQVPKLRHAPRYYLWSPDYRWIAFQRDNGLWAVSPDGATERLLDDGEASRDLVSWWEGKLVFLTYRDDKTIVGLASPDDGTLRTVAILPPVPTFSLAAQLDGSHLALLAQEGRSVGIDLSSGAMQNLEVPPEVAWCTAPTVSPAGRYVLVPGLCNDADLRILDLQTWAVRVVPGRQPLGAAWSFQGDRWAALAGGDPKAGKTSDLFGTALAIGLPDGSVQELKPPLPLKLIDGRLWSPGGKQVLVLSELKPATDGRGRDGIYEAWLVTPESGDWRKLTSLSFTRVIGWHPSGEYLVVWKITSSAGMPEVGRLSPATGEITWQEPGWRAQADPTRLDESLAVATPAGGYQEPAGFLPGPGAGPGAAGGKLVPVMPGTVPYMDSLQIRPPYVSYIEYPKEGPQPSLVVLKR
jgi:hypothetical protein